MKQKNKLILLINLLLFSILSAKAQQSANTGGGNAAGSGGSLAYTVGQPIFTTAEGTGGSTAQGVQQAFVASNPLPLNFISFTSKCTNGNLNLSCATSFETNNAYFDVEKSKNASRWEKVGTVAGALNSNEVKKYAFVDAETETGQYYRIKQTDLDGKYSYSNVIATLGCGNALYSVSIYPNPTTEGVHVNINKTDNAIYELFDLSGRLVESKPLTESTFISMQNQIASAYFLKIIHKNKEVKTFKIIKN